MKIDENGSLTLHQEQVLKWLRDKHGSEMAALNTSDVMRLMRGE